MRAVRGRERVVDPQIAQGGERGEELRIVVLLALVKAGILQTENVAGPQRGDRRLRLRADAVLREGDRPAEDLRHDGRNRPERLLRIRPLRPAEMREQDHLAALVGDLADGRHHPLDPGEIADLAVLEGNVEIDAQQNPLAPEVAEQAEVGLGTDVGPVVRDVGGEAGALLVEGRVPVPGGGIVSGHAASLPLAAPAQVVY